MSHQNARGRWVGLMLLLQLAGLIAPFILLHPIAPSRFMAEAAAAEGQIRLGLLLLMGNCVLTIAIALTTYSRSRADAPVASIAMLMASGLMFGLQAVDSAHIMTMVALSRESVGVGTPAADISITAEVIKTTRLWVHYWELFAIDLVLVTFYVTLYRAKLLPTVLIGLGVLTILLHTAGVTVPLLIGERSIMALGATICLSQVVTAGWLIAKGFPAISD